MTVLNHPINGKIRGLFKAFERFSSTFQGKFSFQGFFKTNQYIQVLFKPVQPSNVFNGHSFQCNILAFNCHSILEPKGDLH